MIKMLKLVSGEELIADVTNWYDVDGSNPPDHVTITDPLQFGMNQGGVVMVPFMPLSESEEMHIRRSAIVTMLNPSTQTRNAYAEACGRVLLMEHGPIIH